MKPLFMIVVRSILGRFRIKFLMAKDCFISKRALHLLIIS